MGTKYTETVHDAPFTGAELRNLVRQRARKGSRGKPDAPASAESSEWGRDIIQRAMGASTHTRDHTMHPRKRATRGHRDVMTRISTRAIQLLLHEGRSVPEVAKILNVSRNTVINYAATPTWPPIIVRPRGTPSSWGVAIIRRVLDEGACA